MKFICTSNSQSTLLYGGTVKLPGDWWNTEPEFCQNLRKEQNSNDDNSGVKLLPVSAV